MSLSSELERIASRMGYVDPSYVERHSWKREIEDIARKVDELERKVK